MPNEKGWYTKAEANETGLPQWLSEATGWTIKTDEFTLLLSKSRCKSLKVPIMERGEKPSAFYYNTRQNGKHKYIPLYDRTDAYNELQGTEFYPFEIRGTKP